MNFITSPGIGMLDSRYVLVSSLPLAANLGGTGVANLVASTLTLGGATTISTGGTIALGGYTLTIPATGTAALLGTANVFTTTQQVTVATTSSIGLILKTSDDNATKNLLELHTSGAVVRTFARSDGSLDIGYTNIPTTSNSILDVGKRDGATSGTSRGMRIQLTPYTGSNSSALYYGLQVAVSPTGGDPNFTGALYGASYNVTQGRTGTVSQAVGQVNSITNSSTGIISIAYGTQIQIINSGGGSITNGYGINITGQNTGAGSIGSFYAIDISDMTVSAGSVTNQYGLYIRDQTKGGTLNYAIYTNVGTVYFGGTLQTNGGRVEKITTVTNTYTVLVTDETVVCNKATNFTVTLPTAVVGQRFHIKNIGAGIVTVDGASTDTIDGDLTQQLIQWESMQLQCYVANKWAVI